MDGSGVGLTIVMHDLHTFVLLLNLELCENCARRDEQLPVLGEQQVKRMQSEGRLKQTRLGLSSRLRWTRSAEADTITNRGAPAEADVIWV